MNSDRSPQSSSIDELASLTLVDLRARVRQMVETEQVSQARELVVRALLSHPEDEELLQWKKLLAAPKVTLRPGTGTDRVEEIQWLRTHAHSYRGMWVAVTRDELVGQAQTLGELLGRLSTVGLKVEPLIHRIP